ncbi:MAG: hypothetical protein MRJ68_19175 [Nitrospira sp.]|nr:hypothetical protein [Nitrospira sp.]
MNIPIDRTLAVLQALLVAFIIGSILIGVRAFADDSPFYFDEAGQVQQRGYWSPNNRSTFDAETDRQAYRNYRNQEIVKQNEELIESYYSSKPTAPLSTGNDNAPYLVYPAPGANPMLCQRSFDAVYCQ